MTEQDTPDFDSESRAAIRDWQDGTITFDEARRKLQSLIQIAQSEKMPLQQGRMHLTMSYLFSLRGRHEHALGWARNAERLFKQNNSRADLAGIYITMGEIYRHIYDFAQASKSFQDAYELAGEVGDGANQLFARGNEGHVALAQRDYSRAINLLEETLTMLEPYLNQDSWLSSPNAVKVEYQTALAEAYFRYGNHDAAWKNMAEAYELARELEIGIEMGKASQTMGKIISGGIIPSAYEKFGTDFKAYFEEANNTFKTIGADLDHALSASDYGDALARAGESNPARVQYQLAIGLYSSLGMYAQVRQVTVRLTQLTAN